MSPNLSPETGHDASKSGLGGVAPGELAELTVLVSSARAVAEIEITASANKMPATNFNLFIDGQVTRNIFSVNASPFNSQAI